MTSVSLRAHRRQHGGQVNLGEVINEQVGGRGAAIHDDQIRFLQRGENAVEFTAVVQIEKPCVGMKPLQRRILVVAINRDVGDALVFEELDEVDGEEAFADAAFAIEDEIESFHVVVRFEHPHLGDARAARAGVRCFAAVWIWQRFCRRAGSRLLSLNP